MRHSSASGTFANHFGLVLLAAFTLFLQSAFAQTSTFTSNVLTGNWNAPGSWTEVGSDVDNIPDADDIVVILFGHNITVNVASSALTLTINNGGTMIAVANYTVPGLGSMTVNAGGTYVHGFNGGVIPPATWASTSNFIVTGVTLTMPTGFNQSFGNLTWNCASQTIAAYFETNLTVQGNLTVLNTNIPGGGSLRMSNTVTGYNLTVNGDFSITTGSFRMNNSTGSCTMTVNGDLTVNAGANFVIVTGGASSTLNVLDDVNVFGTLRLHEDASATVGTLNIGGDLNYPAGGIIEENNNGSGSIIFNTAALHTFTSGGASLGTSIINFSVTGGATLQMAQVPVAIIDGGGSFTLSSGATLGVTSANGITTGGPTGNIQVTGTRTYSSGAHYIYNGTAPQSTGNGLTQNTPANVTINNLGNIVSLSAATSISGALLVTAGTLNASGQTTTVGGLTTVNGTYLASTATQTFNGGLTVSGGTFTGSTGAVSTADMTLSSGTLTAPSGTFTVSGNWLKSGGTFTPGPNTVTFNNTVLRTLNSGNSAFNNISHTGAGTLQLSTNGLATNGAFTNTVGSFDANTQTHTVTGPATISGGSYLASTATQTFNGGLMVAGGTFTGSTGAVSTADMTLSSGTLNAPTGLFTVSGNWTRNGGTFSPGSGAVTFNGVAQTIGGLSPTTFNDVSTSGGTNTSTGISTIINGNLAVRNGTTFTVGGFNFAVGGTTTVGGGASGGLVISSSAGAKTFTGLVTVASGATWNNSGNSNATMRGGLTNSGTFTAGSGLYTFNTNIQSLTGVLAIPNLTVTGITLTNNGNVTVSTALSGSGGLTQAAGSSLTLGGTSGITTLNAINNNNTVTFDGASQVINPTSYHHLTIDQSSGDASISGPTSVNGNLNLTTGNLGLGANLLTLGPTAAIPAPTGFILASSGGEVRKEFIATGSFSFPIGDNTGTVESSPIAVNVTAGTFSSAYVSAKVTDAKHPNNASATNFLTRYWVISQSGISGAIANINATYIGVAGADVNGAVGAIAGAYLSGNFNQVSNPWVKGPVLSGVTMSLTGVPLPAGVAVACTGITDAPPTVAIVGAPVTVCAGTPVSLSTTVSGDATIVYAWTPITGLSSSTISNPVATPLVTTAYTVTIRDGNGITATDVETITVNPTPDVLATPASQVICTGANTGIALSNPNATPGTLYTWTVVQSGVTGAANQVVPVAGPIVQALSATGAVPGTATYSVVPMAGSCSGTALNVVITVNPTPTVGDPADQVVCNTASTTAVNFSGTGTAYNWTNSTPSIGLAASGTGNIGAFAATNAGTTVVVATVTVTPEYTFGAVTCFGTPQVFTITVNPTPTVVAVGNQVVCNGSTTAAVTFSGAVGGTTFNWTNDNTSIGLAASGSGNIAAFAGVNAGAAPVVATITVTPVFAGCAGTPQVFTITVNPTPTVVDPSDQVVCNGAMTGAVTFTGAVGGTTFNWTNSAPGIGLAATGSGNIAAFAAVNLGTTAVVATITVTPQTGGPLCLGTAQIFTITVNPTPTVVAVGNQVLCNGASTAAVTFSGAVGGTTFNWTNNDTSIGLAASGTGNIAAFTGVNAGAVPVVATITVTPVFSGCAGTATNFTITVNPTPTVVDPVDQVVCNTASTAAVTFAGTAGATFNWTNDTPSIGLAASGSGNIAAFAGVNVGTTPVVATITVTPQTAGPLCVGTPQTFTITVNPTPTVGDPADQVVCNTASTTAVNFSGTGTAYNWTNSTPSIGLAASGTGNIGAFAATNAGTTVVVATVTVTPEYTFGAVTCFGTPQVFTITVNPTPTVVAVGNQVVCNGSTTAAVTFSGAVGGTTFNWTNDNTSIGLAASGSGNIAAFAGVNAGAAPVVATITVTPVFAGCAGTPQVFTITVNPTPTVVDPSDQVVCNGAMTGAVTFTGAVGGTTFNWTNDTPSIGLAASGSGNIAAFAAVNLGTTAVVATITVTPQTGGPLCLGTAQIFTITVNPTPTVVAVGNQVLCNGASTAAVTFSGAVGGTTFNWTNNDTSIGLAASGTGNIAAFTGVNAGAVPVVATITVTPVFSGCAGTATNFTITVNPTPTVVDPVDQVVCNTASTAAVTFAGTAGATFNWTNDTPSIGLAASGSGNIAAFAGVNVGTTPVVATITVTPQTAGPLCVGTPQTFTITVNPTPTVGDPADQVVCNTASTTAVNFSGTGTAYNWTNSTPSIGLAASGTGNIGAFAATNAGTTVVVATVTVTPEYTFGAVTCFGTPQVFTITVNPTPTVVAVGNQVVCNGSTTAAVTFSGAVGGTTFNWTNDNTSIGLAASGSGNIAAFAGVNAGAAPVVATITVTPVFAGCAGTPQVFTITVNPTPTVVDPSDQVVCNGAMTGAVTFTGAVGGTTFNWTNDTPSIGLAASGSGNIAAFAAVNLGTTAVVATITVTPQTGGPLCLGTAQIFTITVNPTPTVVAVGNQVLCNGASTAAVTFSGAVGGTTFNWTNNDTSIGLAASGTGNIAAFTGVNAGAVPVVATITVTPVFSGCAGTATNFTITVNPTPTVVDPVDQVVCNTASTAAVTFAGTAGATFNWTNDTPSIGLAASGSGNIAAFAGVNVGTTPVVATITVTPQTAGPLCVGTPQTFTITVNPTPTVGDPADQVVCNTASTTAVNFSGTGTAYNWTNSTPSIGLAASGTGNIGAFAATNAGTTVVVATVTVTPEYTFGAVTCFGTPQVFTITVNPTPTVVAVGNQVVCNGSTTAAVTFSGAVGGTTFNWTNDNTSIGLAASGSGNIAAFAGVNAGAAPVVATITVTPVFAGCAGTPQVFTITVNPTPTVVDPSDQVVCNGAMTGAVTFTGAVGGTTFNWTNDTPSIGLAASGSGNIAAFAAVNLGTTAVVATITVTPQTGGPLCLGTAQIFTITVNPTPTVVAVGNQVVCNGASTAAVTFSGAVGGTTFNWTNNDTSIGLAASGTGNIAAFTGVNAGAVPVVATITVTPVFSGCAGTATNFTITVNPTPTVVDPADQVVCNTASTAAVTFAGTAGATFNWTNDTPSIGLAASGSGNIAAFAGVNVGTTPVVATITVTPQTGGPVCVGTPQTFTITVNPTPTVGDPADQVVCNTASTTAVNFSGTGTAYNWTNSTPSIGLAASGTGNIGAFAATNAGTTVVVATVTVTPEYTFGAVTCFGTPQVFTITVNPTPTVVAVGNQVVCNGSTTAAVTFSGAVGGTTFNWTNDNTSIGLAASGSGNIAAFAGVNAGAAPVVATITVTPVFAGCAGTPQVFTITVNPTPTVVDPSDQVVCNGAMTGAVTFTGAVGGTTFNWTNDTPSIGLAASGSGNIAAFAAVNLGTTAVVATITVTPQTGGPLCLGTAQIFTITVNPTPTVVAVGNQVVCNGASTAAVTFSGAVGGTTFNWTNNDTSIGLAASGTGNIAAFTGVNAGAVPVVATITVTPVFSGCAGTATNFTITVNPTPTVVDPADQVVCNTASTAAVTFAGTAGATFNWTNDTPSIGLAASGSGNIAAFAGVNVGTTPVVATITVTPQTGGPVCVGTPQTFTITVNPTPTVGDPADQVVCNTASTTAVNFSGTGTAYNWTNSTPSIGLAASGTGNIGAFAATNAGTTVVVATVTVTPEYTFGAVTCFGTPQVFTITVNPTPTVVAVGNQVVCNGSTTAAVTFSGAVGGTTFNWTNDTPSIGLAPIGSGSIAAFPAINMGTSSVVATITVTPVFAGCAGAPQTFTVTVQPVPVVTAGQVKTICSGQDVDYKVTLTPAGLPAGTTFSWAAPTMSAGGPQGTAGVAVPEINALTITDNMVNTMGLPITATYNIIATNGTCTGASVPVVITINPAPVITAAQAKTICSGQNVDYKVTLTPAGLPSGTTYSWAVPTMSAGGPQGTAGVAVPESNALTITDNLVNTTGSSLTATYTLTPTSGAGCAGAAVAVVITVDPAPVITAAQNKTICSGDNVNYQVTLTPALLPAGTTFSWAAPTMSAGGPQGTSGSGVLATANPTLNDVLTNATGGPITATYTLTPTGGSGCVGAPVAVVITINPAPVVTAGQAKTICSGQDVDYKVTLTPAGLPAGTTFSWAAPTMSAGGPQGTAGVAVPEINALTITDNMVNIGAVPITATYNIIATNGTCTGASVPVVITVNPVPVGNPVISSSCSDVAIGSANVLTTTGTSVSAANFTIATNPNGLTQLAGTVSTGPLKGPNELIDDVWTNTTGADVNVLYTVTPFSSVGCQGANFTVTVTIHPEPVSGPVVAATVCSDTPAGYNLTTPLAATYNISINSNGLVQSLGTVSAGGGKLAGELADDEWTNTNNAFLSINVVYTVTPVTALGCAGDPFTVTVPVKPEPLGANASISICSSISATPVNYNLQVTNVNGLGNGMASMFDWIVPVNNPNVSGESLTTQVGSVINDILINPTGVDQVVVYNVRPTGTVSGCLGNMFTLTVTVKPAPIGVNQSVTTCSDVSPNYNLLNNVAILGNNVGSTFSWVATPNANVTGESTIAVVGPLITDIVNNVTSSDEVVDYTVTPTGINGCVGADFFIQVTVRPEPVGTTAFAPDICSGNAVNYDLQNNINLSNALPSNFLWSAVANPNVSGDNIFAQTAPIIGDILVNNTFGVETVQYNITPTGVNGCAGDGFSISVNINPSAQISAGPDLVICADQATEILQGVVTYAPNGVSWARIPSSTEAYAPSNLLPNPTYTHNTVVAADGSITHNLIFTAIDPDGPGPCIAVSDAMTLQINGLPFLNVVGLPASIAENKPPVPVSTNRVGGTFFISAGSALPPQYVNGGVDEVLFDPALAALNQNDTLFYTWQSPVSMCRDTVQRIVFVSPVTTIDFGMEYPCSPGPCTPITIARDVISSEFRICSNTGMIHLVGSPPAPNGVPAGTFFVGLPATHDLTGAILQAKLSSVSNDWFLDTDGLPSGDYRLEYNYRENFPPFNDATPISYVVKVWAAPDAVISAPANNCNSGGVPMNSTSFIIGDPAQNPFGASISSHFWTFGGGNAPGFAGGASVNQIYPLAGLYTVTLTVTTTNLCRDTDTFVVQVGQPPTVDFDWAAICTNDLTSFMDLSNPGISTIIDYDWNFGDGNIINGAPAAPAPEGGTYMDPKHNYVSSAVWNVTLTVTTNDNCTNTITKPVPILTGGATVAPTPAAPYFIDFNSAPGSWIPQRLDTGNQISWKWAVPAGINITGVDNAWWTGYRNGPDSTYYDYEQTAVNGPCFDLTNLQRPMIELDYWSDTEKNTDGAVVQYSTDGGLFWRLVGPLLGQPRDQGINWYDPAALITSDPGQQVKKFGSIGAYGWTDKSGQWKRAKFSLDNVPVGSRGQVRIRIAFSSNDQNAFGAQYDGFAFDNVLVGEKSRRVLVENFTNSPLAPTIDQDWIRDRYNSQIGLRGTGGSDFYYVNYHVEYPNPDPLNLENRADPSARASFMGVSESPRTIIDGIIDNVKFTGAFTNLDNNGIEADRRALVNPQFALILDTVATSNQNTIRARLTMTALQPVADPLLLQVLLVESQTGTYPYLNVVRKQLLGADGVTIAQTFALNDVRVETGNEVTINVPITNPGMLTLIGYVQNKNTREIYQSVILPAPIKRGAVVVGLEDQPSTLNGITMYPNPANGKLFLGVPDHALVEGFSWKLIDQRGVMVKSGDLGDLVNGAREITVSDLANGMYIMQLTGPGYSVVHRKVMVMNRN